MGIRTVLTLRRAIGRHLVQAEAAAILSLSSSFGLPDLRGDCSVIGPNQDGYPGGMHRNSS